MAISMRVLSLLSNARTAVTDLELTEEDVSPFSIVEEFTFPKPRQAGKILSGELSEVVSQTVRYLQEDAKVI